MVDFLIAMVYFLPMTASELRSKYIEFFKTKGHTQIPSASLIPENDPTVLFTTAGMHPLVPFLLGQKHPAGQRIVNYQRCIRTSDIDLVGDDTHLTFFEMLGNWSFGDPSAKDGIGRKGYFKKEAIEWSWEFLTSKKWLELDPEKISVSVFAGDVVAPSNRLPTRTWNPVPRDEESATIWRSVGVPDERIYYLGRDKNWWEPAGRTGSCGPDTEMFYDTGKQCTLGKGSKCDPSCDCGKFVEIWNDVFMQYNKVLVIGKDMVRHYVPLKQKNVDTGMGLERTLAVLNGVKSVYETELFAPLVDLLIKRSSRFNEYSARIIADHIKTSVFLLADGVLPSNKDQGYVLRRLIRKVVREGRKLGVEGTINDELMEIVIGLYKDGYPFLAEKKKYVVDEFCKESLKFTKTLEKGNKFLQKEVPLIKEKPERAGQVAFDLYQTYGFPPEITFEILTKEENVNLEQYMFNALYRDYLKAHQEKSRKGAEHKFAGGLADHSERVVRMHTATHLLHQALRDVLGPEVFQKGSNITSERLRFDLSFPRKVTSEELQKVEAIVNEQVQKDMIVTKKIIPLDEAKKLGAIGLFGEKYGDSVSVYIMGDYSKEFCGGPHVEHTGQVGKFKILKEEAVSAGVRRIKAVVQ